MTTVLITGANRGIGLEFVRQYAADGAQVFACCRNPDGANDLNALAGADGDVTVLKLDVADEASIAAARRQVGDAPIDILINNAGVLLNKDETIEKTDYAAWMRSFEINVLGPFRVISAFKDNVAKSDARKIMTLSSQMGSIGDASGGYYTYRSTKAGANMVMKALANDLSAEGIVVLPVHPGWVKTDMGGSGAMIEASESVAGLRAVLDAATPESTGRFYRFDGKEAPW